MVVAASITALANSFSASSSHCTIVFQSRALTTPKVQWAFPTYATAHPCEWFSPTIIDANGCKIELRPLIAPVRVGLTRRLLVRSCVDSPTKPQSDNLFLFFREIGLDEEEIDSLLAKSSTLRCSSLDRIHGRVLALQSVGIKGLSLCRLITKYPRVLTAEEIDQLVSFVHEELPGKIEPAQLQRLFSSTAPKFLVGFDRKVKLLIHHGVPGEKIAHVLNNVNLSKAFCLKSVEEVARVITFLEPYGGADIIVRRPSILNYDLEVQLIPRIRFLSKLSGGDEDATAKVLRKLPSILSYSVQHMEGHVELLRSYAGLSEKQIFKIILVFPNVISASRERKLQPRIEFLKQCSLSSSEIFKFLTRAPLFLALSFDDNLAHKLGFLVKIGYECKTKELAVALGAVTRTSCENTQKVIGVFLSYGFSYADIVTMSKKHPQILQYNPGSLEEKMEYLIEGMGREVSELLAFPAFLGYKLDDRIKHRYEVKRNIVGDRMSLNKLLTVSADRFLSINKRETPSGTTYQTSVSEIEIEQS